MASALGVPLVRQPMYPYTETPSLDDIMSLLTGTTIGWGTDPRITSMSLLSSIICFSGYLVIPFGLSLIYTLFLLRDVHFCTLLSPMLL